MIYRFFEGLARWTTAVAGSTIAFIIACGLILAWLFTGPLFDFSDTWQLVINTGTTIVTFLMVFLIQRTQNKDSLALQIKLNELLAAHAGASNKLLNIENLSEEEIQNLQQRYYKLADKAQLEDDCPLRTHTIEEIDPATVKGGKPYRN
jgi:low affinity Fe/Cu permease